MAKATVIEQLAVSLSLEASSFTKQMQTIDKTIKNSEKSFKNASKGVEGYEKSYVGLDAKMQKTSKQIDLYNIKLDKQKSEYTSLEAVLTSQKQKLDSLEATLGKGSAEWQKQAELVSRNSTNLSKLQTDITGTNSNINKLTQELSQTKKEFEELGNKTKTTGEKLEGIEKNALVTESAFNKMGAELELNGTFFQKLGNEMNQIAFKLDDGVQKVTIYESEIKKLSTILELNRAEHMKLGQEINSTENELNQVKSAYGENSTEASQLGKKLLELKDDYNRLDTEIGENRTALDGYQTELNNTEVDVVRLSRELKNMPFDAIGDKMKSTGSTVRGVGQDLTMGVTTPFALAGAGAVKAGIDFGSAVSALEATLGPTKATAENMEKLEKSALNAGGTTSKSATDSANALGYMALAGWDVEECVAGLMPMLRLSEAGNIDLAAASDLVTDSMGGLGIGVDGLSGYLDKVAKTSQTTNTTIDTMLEAFNATSGPAKTLGIDVSELSGAIGTLANSSYKGSEGGKALSTVLTRLAKPPTEAAKSLNDLGVSVFDSNGKFRELETVLGDLNGSFSSLTEEEAIYHAKNISGQSYISEFITLVDGADGTMQGYTEAIKDSDGTMEQMAETMQENLGGEITTMQSAIETGLLAAFKAMEPVLSKVIECITDVAKWFAELDEEQQKNIVTMAGLAMAVGPLLMGIGQFIIVGGNAVTLFGKLGSRATATTAATTGVTGAMGILAGPVGIGLAVAALVGFIAMIGENENALLMLQEKFGGLGTEIGAVCEFISGVVQLTFGNLAIVIMGIFDIIGAIIDGPGGATMSDAWDRMNSKLVLNNEEAMSKITLGTTRGMSQMLNASEEALNGLVTTTDVMLANIPGIVDGNYKDASNNLGTQLATMDSTQIGILQGMNDTTKQMFQGIREGMTVDEASNQVEVNLNQMSKAGKINGDTMTKDVTSSMDTFKKQLSEKTKDASKEVDTNTKEVAKVTDTNTKEAAKSAEKNMDKAAKETKEAAKDMSKNATSSANEMEKNVTSATYDMASESISDWNRIRNSYSNPIYGRVSVTKTITEQTRTRSIPNNIEGIAARGLDLSSFRTQGSYFNSGSENSTTLIKQDNTFSNELKQLLKELIRSKEDKEPKIEINIENFNGNDKSDLNKLVEMISIKLKQIENRNNKTKGENIYAV